MGKQISLSRALRTGAAGVLVGWTESGARPKFDIVTGVSTGAGRAVVPAVVRAVVRAADPGGSTAVMRPETEMSCRKLDALAS